MEPHTGSLARVVNVSGAWTHAPPHTISRPRLRTTEDTHRDGDRNRGVPPTTPWRSARSMSGRPPKTYTPSL